jgi:hypothetical protein
MTGDSQFTWETPNHWSVLRIEAQAGVRCGLGQHNREQKRFVHELEAGPKMGCCACRYEGEFFHGFAHGLGAFTSAAGEVYRGEWRYGKRSG